MHIDFYTFFNADELGIEARITEIKNEIGLEESTQLSNGSIIDFDGSEWGGYIFHDVHTQRGTLEDQLLGYFHNKSQQLQQDILHFLQTNVLLLERTRRFVSTNAGESYSGRSQYYEKKSVLGMYAQLQFSGVSNAFLISNTDFLKAVDINRCQQCALINSLFM
ncbi:TPA: hypothetical protein ACHV3Y_005306 [Klebsiella variicola]